jgi:hypothetical protein
MGCGASTVRVEGDVFIVTNSGVSVKLALVEVQAVPGAEVAKFLKARIDATISESKNLQAAAEEASARISEADQNLKKLPEEDERFFQLRLHRGQLGDADELFGGLQRKRQAAFEARGSWQKKLDEVNARLAVCRSTSMYFRDLPPGVVSVKTDADGKFTLNLPRKQKVVLLAQARRQILDKTEFYYWMVPLVPDKNTTGRGFLSNDNLVNGTPEEIRTLFYWESASTS